MSHDPLEQVASAQSTGPSVDTIGSDVWMAEKCPTLLALMSVATHKGRARKTATVTVFFDEQDGRLKAVINDREAAKSLWVTLEDGASVFESIEDSLSSNGQQWRSKGNRYAGNRGSTS